MVPQLHRSRSCRNLDASLVRRNRRSRGRGELIVCAGPGVTAARARRSGRGARGRGPGDRGKRNDGLRSIRDRRQA
jgi:hypothetical protein